MKAAQLIATVIVIVFLGSCSKTCYCDTAIVNYSFVAFDSSETDTVILFRYPKGSNFNGLLDSTVLTAQNADFHFNVDTLSISSDTAKAKMVSYFNYIVYLPSIDRRDSIRNIFEVRETKEGGHDLACNCVNQVLSYQLNSDTLQVINPASPQVYIYK